MNGFCLPLEFNLVVKNNNKKIRKIRCEYVEKEFVLFERFIENFLFAYQRIYCNFHI